MKINGHDIGLGNILTILGMLAAIGATWGTLSADNASIKQKVENVEQRAKEDRRNTREAINEVKGHVEMIDKNTQLILQELRAMQAVQKAERSRR